MTMVDALYARALDIPPTQDGAVMLSQSPRLWDSSGAEVKQKCLEVAWAPPRALISDRARREEITFIFDEFGSFVAWVSMASKKKKGGSLESKRGTFFL